MIIRQTISSAMVAVSCYAAARCRSDGRFAGNKFGATTRTIAPLLIDAYRHALEDNSGKL